MSESVYLIPERARATWNPVLEALELIEEPGGQLSLLGYVSADRPVETPEGNDDDAIR